MIIEKNNIPLEDKLTKKILYILNLDRDYWSKKEFDSIGQIIYFETSLGYWAKSEYDNEGKRVYFENSNRYIKDDRKTKH